MAYYCHRLLCSQMNISFDDKRKALILCQEYTILRERQDVPNIFQRVDRQSEMQRFLQFLSLITF